MKRTRSIRSLPACESRRVRRCFTLIELLTVIGIIAALAAMLFPVIGSMTARGRTAVCLSNIRQIGMLHLLYTDAADGVFCPAWDMAYNQWDASGDYRAEGTLSKVVPIASASDSEVYSCPEGKISLYRQGVKYAPKFAGYGYNYLLSFASGKDAPPNFRPVRRTEIARPSRTCLLADAAALLSLSGGTQAGPSSFLMPPSSGRGGYADFRHAGQAVLVYVDGHMATQEKIFRSPSLPAEYADRMGYLSGDDSAYAPY